MVCTAFNQRSANLDAIRRFACYAKDVEGKSGRWRACSLVGHGVRAATDLGRRSAAPPRDWRFANAAGRSDRPRTRLSDLLYLDTFSFQAPQFYYRLGYQIACRFDGFPDGESKFILRKSLIS